MRFETTDFITWRLWFSHIAKSNTFRFEAGALWREGKLIYYIQTKEAEG